MPRQAAIWLRKQTGWYCTTVNGDVIKLSKDKKEAQALFHKVMAEKEEPEPAGRIGIGFKKLADDFLTDTQGQKSNEALVNQATALQAFCDRNKGLRAADMKGHMVTKWLAWENEWRAKEGRKIWNASTQSLAIRTIKAVLNWGVKQGHLKENPIKKLSNGKTARRERVLTPDERRRIREFVSADFADYLFVVERTGARPYSEVGKLEARHIDLEAGTATLALHKTAKKTGRPRVLFFAPDVLELVKKRVERYPTGLLFRTRRDSGWNRNNASKWMTAIKEKLGIQVCLYNYRHSMITNAIINGVPVEVVAALVGNTPQVIHSNYAHVGKDQAALRAAAAKAVS